MPVAEPLLLVGAGALAGEVVAVVQAMNASRRRFEVVGLVDDDVRAHGSERFGVPVLGPVDEVASHPSARVVVCTGSPRNWWSRSVIVDRLALDEDRYAAIVHPSAALAPDTLVGPGSVVLAGCVATSSVRVGSHVVLMPQVVLTHDDDVGDGATFGSGVRLGGGVVIERGAYLGAGSLVREHVRVGAWSFVGMGAVVLADVPGAEVWAGSPARRLRAAELPEGVGS